MEDIDKNGDGKIGLEEYIGMAGLIALSQRTDQNDIPEDY